MTIESYNSNIQCKLNYVLYYYLILTILLVSTAQLLQPGIELISLLIVILTMITLSVYDSLLVKRNFYNVIYENYGLVPVDGEKHIGISTLLEPTKNIEKFYDIDGSIVDVEILQGDSKIPVQCNILRNKNYLSFDTANMYEKNEVITNLLSKN